MSEKHDKEILKAVKKWRKAKSKLTEAQAEEAALRANVDTLMGKSQTLVIKAQNGNEEFKFVRKSNYSIPKASFVDIKSHVPDKQFEELFSTSYKLKEGVYNKLSDGEVKDAIKKHLVIKPAPLSVTIKEL